MRAEDSLWTIVITDDKPRWLVGHCFCTLNYIGPIALELFLCARLSFQTIMTFKNEIYRPHLWHARSL